MFTPINPEIIEIIKTQGNIRFFVFEGWNFIAESEVFTTIPHKIVYVKRYAYEPDGHHRIFNCKLTLNKHSLILEEIVIANERELSLPSIVPISKSTEYMFLEMTIKAAENMARLDRKERIIITSKLPVFSEIASELNFSIRKPNFSSYFKATKILQYEKGQMKNETGNKATSFRN